MADRLPIILDVDTGTDDALAIAYVTRHPRFELLAATTVAGNIGVEQATANTLAVLDWLGATDVPVHRGASRPLVRPHQDAAYFHHEGGLGGADLPSSTRGIGPDRGPAAMIRLARERPGEVTLVCVGPLTNLAIALNVEPGMTDLVKEVVLMGGAYHVPGNTTPAAEFNILVDPEAAEQVFAAPFKRLTAVGLDVTQPVSLTRLDWAAANADDGLPRSASLLREIGKFAFAHLNRDQFALHDPLAAAIALNPGLVQIEDASVTVDVDGPETGRTRILGPGHVRVAVAVDADAALADFRQIVGLPTMA